MSKVRSMRYVEDDPQLGMYSLHDMSLRGRTRVGRVSDRPQWLVDIVSVAKVGGHGVAMPTPPPTYILWFGLTDDNQLTEFIQI